MTNTVNHTINHVQHVCACESEVFNSYRCKIRVKKIIDRYDTPLTYIYAFTRTGINAHALVSNVKTQRHKCSFTFFMKCADIVHFIFAPRTLNISNFNKRRRPMFHFLSFSSLVFCRIFFKIQFQFV